MGMKKIKVNDFYKIFFDKKLYGTIDNGPYGVQLTEGDVFDM